MSASASASAFPPRSRGSLATWLAFGVGVPMGITLLWAFHAFAGPADGSLVMEMLHRYLHNPVEMVEVVLFFCALGALLGKLLTASVERLACNRALLPRWDGKSQPAAAAAGLETELRKQPTWLQHTYLGRRLAAVLEFVRLRGSADELDDQVRTLADNDAMATESSYSLLRLIIWAIPILGFLGTVLGIAGAISAVDPEKLEQQLNQVTGGLAMAFDTTALALGLTMVLMFLSFLVEQVENGQLRRVDQIVDAELAHRFERVGSDNALVVDVLRHNTQILLEATQQLVERQAAVWAKSLAKIEETWNAAGQLQLKALTAALHQALDQTLKVHDKRLLAQEEQAQTRVQGVVAGIQQVAAVVRETSKQQQEALVQVAGKVADETKILARLHEGEGQLLRLQESLQHNLATLTASGSFEQAVHSLTAAIHLLTARAHIKPPLAA